MRRLRLFDRSKSGPCSTNSSSAHSAAWTAAPAERRRRGRRLRRVAANVVFVVVALGWFFLLAPTWLGGPATIVRVTGDSMEPSMHTGDLVIAHAQNTYEVGDVVAFRVPNDESGQRPYVIHRIVDEQEGVFTLRGDNNDYDDPWAVHTEDISGRLWLHAPDAGNWVLQLADPIVLAALCAAATAFVVCIGPSETTEGPRRRDSGGDQRTRTAPRSESERDPVDTLVG